MKILVLCMSPGMGGLELYVRRVMQWMNKLDVDCMSVVSPQSILETYLRSDNVLYQTLTSFSKYFPLIASKKLAAIIDQQEVDVIHIHWGRDLCLAVYAKLMAKRKIKLVYTRHMEITRSKRDRFHHFFYKQVDKLIVGTRQLYEEAHQYIPLPEDSIVLSYIGVPEAPPVNKDRCQVFFNHSKLEKKTFRIGLFGRIEHGKGQHVLVDAMEKLVNNDCDVGTAIIGHVMDETYLGRLMSVVESKGLSECIEFKGYIENPQSIMGCFDVVVLTTYCETFGLVLAEAMRAGVAVIGTNAGGVPEIIEDGETGLLFGSGNSNELANVLLGLYKDPGRKEKIAAAGKRRADERFSEEQHFESLKAILQSL